MNDRYSNSITQRTIYNIIEKSSYNKIATNQLMKALIKPVPIRCAQDSKHMFLDRLVDKDLFGIYK